MNFIIRSKRQGIFLAAILVLGYFTLCLDGLRAQSTTPQTISYQGLIHQDGLPVSDGEHVLKISLYTQPTGGESIWNETQTVSSQSGVINLLLGSTVPLPPAKSLDKPLWVGISIGGVEMSPRTQLTSSPYAMNVADQSITAKKLATDYVSSIRVNGKKVTGQAASVNITGGDGLKVNFDEATQSIQIDAPSLNQEAGNSKGRTALAATLFSDITTAANTTATMTVGTGASVVLSGTGVVEANKFKTSASTSDNVDLATSEVNGILPVANGGTGGTGVSAGAWLIGGNATTVTQSMGTSSNKPVQLITNGQRTVIYDPIVGTTPTIVGGYSGNSYGGKEGVFIGGGGASSAVNSSPAAFGVITGGRNNVLDNSSDSSFIGGGTNNTISGKLSVISGGTKNSVGELDVIGGGENNSVSGTQSLIGAGKDNRIDEDFSSIVGGEDNTTKAPHSFIGGGQSNQIGPHNEQHPTYGSVIAGGAGNIIGYSASTPTAPSPGAMLSFIGGGDSNYIYGQQGVIPGSPTYICNAAHSVIVGGHQNFSAAYFFNCPDDVATFIGGGSNNKAYSTYNNIVGGQNNLVGLNVASKIAGNGSWISIVGGRDNQAVGDYGFIGGGRSNTVGVFTPGSPTEDLIGLYSSVVGGQSNFVKRDYSFIGGGQNNKALEEYSVISGGRDNNDSAQYSTIGGGYTNIIHPNSDYSTIAGGDDNEVSGTWVTIGGGVGNIALANKATIAGGFVCSATGIASTVGGGYNNAAFSDYSTVCGGYSSYVGSSAQYGSIVGGDRNIVAQDYGFIGGGAANYIYADGVYASVLGQSNVASSYAQTCIGFQCEDVHLSRQLQGQAFPYVSLTDTFNSPLFEVGNGRDPLDPDHHRGNAFEVSYNGHSVVSDVNGSGTSRASIAGATYQDNVIYAWGETKLYSGPEEDEDVPMPMTSDFGVDSVIRNSKGDYSVYIHVVDKYGNPVDLSNSAVVATIRSGSGVCRTITTGSLRGNAFSVFIKDGTRGGIVNNAVVMSCEDADEAFTFIVTGRPQ